MNAVVQVLCNYRVSVSLSRRQQPPFDTYLTPAPERSSGFAVGRAGAARVASCWEPTYEAQYRLVKFVAKEATISLVVMWTMYMTNVGYDVGFSDSSYMYFWNYCHTSVVPFEGKIKQLIGQKFNISTELQAS